eukprot:6090114-Ditylum_brightwellii.AAC.1
MTGDLPPIYEHKDLLNFMLKLYSNRKVASKWDGTAKEQMKKFVTNEDTKFLAMITNLEQPKRAMETAGINPMSKTKPGDGEKGSGPRFMMWRFENKEGKETLEVHNRTYCWCTNNFHPKLMWCTQTNCLNRADVKANIAKEKYGRGGGAKK